MANISGSNPEDQGSSPWRRAKYGTVAKGVLLHETENLAMSARLGPVPQMGSVLF
jgi:hypothetical protein